jgi:hypothetical protein
LDISFALYRYKGIVISRFYKGDEGFWIGFLKMVETLQVDKVSAMQLIDIRRQIPEKEPDARNFMSGTQISSIHYVVDVGCKPYPHLELLRAWLNFI